MATASVVLALTAPTVRRATAGNLDKLREMPNYRDAVFSAAQTTPAWVNERCADAKAQISNDLGVMTTPEIDDAGRAEAGVWIEHVHVEGCGRTRQFNVLVRVRMPGSITMAPLLPGTTRADPRLQDDGATYAFAAAALDPKGCTPTYIAETKFIEMLTGVSSIPGKAAWSELWTVVQCVRTMKVMLRFTPDQTGTVVTATRAPP